MNKAIKAIAIKEFEEAVCFLQDEGLSSNVVLDAADMAADRVMYALGMCDYARFQKELDGLDVADWLVSQHE